MSTALTAHPGLHSTATAVSTKAKVKGKNKKRKKSTMAGGACATRSICHDNERFGGVWHLEHGVTIEDPPISFSPFSTVDCTMLNHFSFNDFVAIAFPDLAGDLDVQI